MIQVEPPAVEWLRIQAKGMRRASNGQLSDCQDHVARLHGFKDWQDLKANHPEEIHYAKSKTR